jgi:hypothetical protein
VTPATPAQRSASTYRGTIRHFGPCGHRRRCYRVACRAEFRDYATVEVVAGTIIYYCHRQVVPIDPIDLAMLDAAA